MNWKRVLKQSLPNEVGKLCWTKTFVLGDKWFKVPTLKHLRIKITSFICPSKRDLLRCCLVYPICSTRFHSWFSKKSFIESLELKRPSDWIHACHICRRSRQGDRSVVSRGILLTNHKSRTTYDGQDINYRFLTHCITCPPTQFKSLYKD